MVGNNTTYRRHLYGDEPKISESIVDLHAVSIHYYVMLATSAVTFIPYVYIIVTFIH